MIWCLFLFSPLLISALVLLSSLHQRGGLHCFFLVSSLSSYLCPGVMLLFRSHHSAGRVRACLEADLVSHPALWLQEIASSVMIGPCKLNSSLHGWAVRTIKVMEECECALGLSEPQRAVLLTSVECQAWGWG